MATAPTVPNEGFSIDSIKELMDGFDPASLLPQLNSVFGKIELVCRILVMLGPALLLALGLVYLFLTPREASDAICEATGADGVAVIGTKFVIYRFSEKLQEERNQTGRAKRKAISVAKANPVRKGAKARRQAAKAQREQRNEYFRQQAIDKAIEREREKQLRKEQ